jgi:hypothetical protein
MGVIIWKSSIHYFVYEFEAECCHYWILHFWIWLLSLYVLLIYEEADYSTANHASEAILMILCNLRGHINLFHRCLRSSTRQSPKGRSGQLLFMSAPVVNTSSFPPRCYKEEDYQAAAAQLFGLFGLFGLWHWQFTTVVVCDIARYCLHSRSLCWQALLKMNG